MFGEIDSRLSGCLASRLSIFVVLDYHKHYYISDLFHLYIQLVQDGQEIQMYVAEWTYAQRMSVIREVLRSVGILDEVMRRATADLKPDWTSLNDTQMKVIPVLSENYWNYHSYY